MWKAIWWALTGLPLGFVFGLALGAGAGAIVATVVTAAAGAVSWTQARRCATRCRGCAVMCEPRSRGVPVRAYAAVAGAAVVVVAVHAVLPFLLPLVAVAVVLAVVSVPVMRRAARRVCVPRWSAAYKPPVRRVRSHYGERVTRAAVTAGPRAIEGKIYNVTPDMILAQAVKEETR